MKCILLLTLLATFAKGDITTIVSPESKAEQLATGMKFTEGPVWLAEKNLLVFSDIPNSKLMQWSAEEGLKVYQEVEQANGNMIDQEGRILSCQHAGRNIIRTEKDGTVTVLLDEFEGKKFNSPNDLAMHPDGSLWFTDPSYGLGGREAELEGKWVFRHDLKTKETTVVYKGFDMPNGIGFSTDYKTLYIANTGKVGEVRAFAVKEKTIEQEPLFVIPIRCDGLCIDTEGNVYTTSKGGIHVFDKTGKKISMIPVAEQPANVCFGGEDFDTLYITARKSLYAVKTKMKGMK